MKIQHENTVIYDAFMDNRIIERVDNKLVARQGSILLRAIQGIDYMFYEKDQDLFTLTVFDVEESESVSDIKQDIKFNLVQSNFKSLRERNEFFAATLVKLPPSVGRTCSLGDLYVDYNVEFIIAYREKTKELVEWVKNITEGINPKCYKIFYSRESAQEFYDSLDDLF